MNVCPKGEDKLQVTVQKVNLLQTVPDTQTETLETQKQHDQQHYQQYVEELQKIKLVLWFIILIVRNLSILKQNAYFTIPLRAILLS